MIIAIVGKRRAGKTTLTALLARWYAREFGAVRVFDSSPNRSLARACGLATADVEGAQPKSLASFAAGEPSGSESAPDVHGVDGIELLVGEDGSVSPAAEDVAASELSIVDVGPDAPRAILNHADLVLVVCDPDEESIRAWQRWREAAESHVIQVRAVGNRVEDKYDVHWLLGATNAELITCLALSDVLGDANQLPADLDQLEFGNQEVLAILSRELHRRAQSLDDKVISANGAFGSDEPLGFET